MQLTVKMCFQKKIITMELLNNNNNVRKFKDPPVAAEEYPNTTGYLRGKAWMRTLCPYTAKSPCILSVFSLASCRQTEGCSTDLAQSRGIFSSPIKAVCRVYQVSQYLCKHLVIATQGEIKASPLYLFI